MKVIIYHASCYDGFGAAYSCWKKFGEQDVKYIAQGYGEELKVPQGTKDDELYIVDFSFDKPTLTRLCEQYGTVHLWDHHKTALEALKDWIEDESLRPANLDLVFDMGRSGAKITWEQLHEEQNDLINCISDRDIWKFQDPRSKFVHIALVAKPMDFKLWDSLTVDELVAEGKPMIELAENQVQTIIKKSWVMKIGGIDTPVVNTSLAWSEVGDELLKKHPEHKMAACFTVYEGFVKWSLRSVPEFDCSAVAKKYGGGGHKNAAGFETKGLFEYATKDV